MLRMKKAAAKKRIAKRLQRLCDPKRKKAGASAPAFFVKQAPSLIAVEQDATRFVVSHLADRAVKELIVFQVDLEERGTVRNAPGNQRLGQRILHVPLQRTAQWPCSIRAVDKCLFQNPLLGVFGHRQRDRLLDQIGVQLLYQQLQDLNQILIRKGNEDDDFIQPVQELRVEGSLHLVLDQLSHLVHQQVFTIRLQAKT